jgi:anti-sigma factor ChrR (cupin superfamily)
VNKERLLELAAAFSDGEITAEERAELLSGIESAPPEDRLELAALVDSAALLSLLATPVIPPASLKEKIMARTSKPQSIGLSILRNVADEGWQPMKVPGAYVKLLSMNQERGYAVALGKLDPKTSYPPHVHLGPEEVLVLTGDLSIGNVSIKAGDFHRAEAGSRHDINYSENGCTILIVITVEDLMAQMT